MMAKGRLSLGSRALNLLASDLGSQAKLSIVVAVVWRHV